MATRKAATRKWSAKVDTDSTHPDQGLFKKSASTIAKALATKEVSPKGPASGMRMLNFYINRAGKNLSPSRVKVLEHAKEILSQIIASQTPYTPVRSAAKKATKAAAKQAVGLAAKKSAKKAVTKTSRKTAKKSTAR